MKISRIKIENFRSIKSAEFDLSPFNIFVGQNNCGKTNFFEAVEFFYNGVKRGIEINDLKYKRIESKEILVEIEFTGAQNGAQLMQNDTNRTKILSALNGSDKVVFKRFSTDSTKRKMFVNGSEVRPGTGFDKALNDFLPKFEYINTKQYYDSVAKYTKTTPVGIMLSGVLNEILKTNEDYRDFQERFQQLFEGEGSQIKTEFENVGSKVKTYLSKQFSDCSNVKFEVTIPAFDDLLKNFSTMIDDGIETNAEEKGDGMQRALMLSIIQAYADFRRESDEASKSFLFFIDEAELHLHPTAQRNLKEVLYSLSQGDDQVFINTHSSVFVVDNHSEQSLFKVEKEDGCTNIEKINDIQKPYVVFELLGGSPSDLLLPRNFLIVEGQSEFELLTRVINRFYKDKPQIQILKAQGDINQVTRSIAAIEKAYRPLQLSIYRDILTILIDAPSEQTKGGVQQFKDDNKDLIINSQFFELNKRDIEQCYPDKECDVYSNWRKTQAEVDNMNGKKKKQLAKHVGDNITKEEFESYLQTCLEALNRCWELSI